MTKSIFSDPLTRKKQNLTEQKPDRLEASPQSPKKDKATTPEPSVNEKPWHSLWDHIEKYHEEPSVENLEKIISPRPT